MTCKFCTIPVDVSVLPLRRAGGKLACHACYELWFLIHENAHFLGAHIEWEMEVKKLNRLRIGEDYLTEIEGEDGDGS